MCVCNIWRDVKLLLYFLLHIYIYILRGVTGVPGGSVTNEDTSRDPWKRTRRTSVVHLGAFKSQLVATVVLYIYIYIIRLGPGFMGFSSRRITSMIQFYSSVCFLFLLWGAAQVMCYWHLGTCAKLRCQASTSQPGGVGNSGTSMLLLGLTVVQ